MNIAVRPRVGIVTSHPIQYFSPLYDLLSRRGILNLSVTYWNDAGYRPAWDAGFGTVHEWDIDLVGGHRHEFLTRGENPGPAIKAKALVRLGEALRSLDVVIINGYASMLTATAIAICQARSIPYLFRTDSSTLQFHSIVSPRHWWPRYVSRRSAGALAVGELNAACHRSLGSPQVFSAPFAVDTARFAENSRLARSDRSVARAAFGLPPESPVVAFAGKFINVKRPGDLISVARQFVTPAHFMMIGDGPLRAQLEEDAQGLPVTFTGFLNQSQMPTALGCVDVLVLPSEFEPWGLIVNEAMASGCIPVVSSRVGCGPDLVAGLGEIYPCGDYASLSSAIDRAIKTCENSSASGRMAERLARYGLDNCASGYESAVLVVCLAIV